MPPDAYSFAAMLLPAFAVWCIVAGAHRVARRSWVDLAALGILVQLPLWGLWLFNRQVGAVSSWAVNAFFLIWFAVSVTINLIRTRPRVGKRPQSTGGEGACDLNAGGRPAR